MKYSLLSFCFICTISLDAQKLKLSGRVIASDDKSGIPYAHISLSNSAVGTISNVDGYFEFLIDPADWSPVIVSSVGFISIKISDTGSWHKSIELKPLINELDEVVVTTSRDDISPKKLVNDLLKQVSKVDKDLLLKMDIERVVHHKGIRSRYYFNQDAELTRNLSSSWGSDIDPGAVEMDIDAGALQASTFILLPENLLSTDIYSKPDLAKAKGKYSYKITGVDEIGGIEVVEITVLDQSNLRQRNATVRNDYKFYFDLETLELLKFERNEMIEFGEGFSKIHTIEHTVAYYDPSKLDPLMEISVEMNQFITRLNRAGEQIDIENKREVTRGSVSELKKIDFESGDYYSSVVDALSRNTEIAKCYLYVFWDEETPLYTYHDELYELDKTFPFDEIEIICIGSTKTKEKWKLESSSYPLFSHYYSNDPSQFQKESSKKRIQLVKNGRLILASNKIDDQLKQSIQSNIN